MTLNIILSSCGGAWAMIGDPDGVRPDGLHEWQTVAPGDAGFVRDLAERMDVLARSGAAAQLHGVVVIRHGRLVVERYGSGPDYKWNEALGMRTFAPEELHDIRSVTKSVTSLLYGIALARGRCPEPSEPLLPQFSEYPDLAADADRARLTVEHALTMTLGIEWNEDVPYTTPANSEIAMEMAPDRYRFVLERPIVEEPGVRWHYCGGATALIGRLIERGFGVALADFAQDALFGPLGIGSFEWMAGSDGVASPASGLRMAPRDLARIGQCVLDGGRWEGREIVPAAWLERALRPHVEIAPGFAYGYQWYLGHADATVRRRVPWVGGMGNGGQRLFVVRELGLVVAISAGAYDAEDQSATPDAVLGVVLDGLE